jgi:dienelactone hydrolase
VSAGGEPSLHVEQPDGPVRGIALVLHGGRARSHQSVPPLSLAVLRMAPFAGALERAGGPGGLAVARLRFRVRGWNGDERSPVPDARWALDQLSERYPDVPIGLVGHSMGGRTALYVADHDSVVSAVLLAPWIEPGDPEAPLTGRRVLIVHGTLDRMTDPRASAALAQRARPLAAQLTYVQVKGDRHAMLRRAALWHRLTAGFTVGAVLNPALDESTEPAGTNVVTEQNVVTEALAGAPSLVV